MAQFKDDTILEAQRNKQKFFGMTREQATQVMLKVHREGIGVCGVYPHDVAATKVQQVAAYSRKHQHPLQCVMEET
jgi:ATP-dependent Clp protease adaptor protein ClpS